MKRNYLFIWSLTLCTLAFLIGFRAGRGDCDKPDEKICNTCNGVIRQSGNKIRGTSDAHQENDHNGTGNPTCWHYCSSGPSGPDSYIPSPQAYQEIHNYGKWAGIAATKIEEWYKERNSNFNDTVQLAGGWTIPVYDLLNDLNGAQHIRAYLAMTDDPEEIPDNSLPKIKLILAIVDNHHSDSIGRDRISDRYYNLIRPCPSICDTSSHLYHNYRNGKIKGRELMDIWPTTYLKENPE